MESGGFACLLTMLFSLKYASILAYTKSYIQQKAEAGRFPQLLMFTACKLWTNISMSDSANICTMRWR